jgi:multidrug efflux pump subunit AcrB
MSILGTIGLVGVSVNDSIVVVAALQALPPHLQRQRKAIREVVIASTRHILTTTLTTVTGFVPLFLHGGAFWEPLAICISIGVIGTTLSALVFVPSGWYYLAQAQKVSPLSVPE